MALPNYVKFQRGTLVAYNRLAQKDENTLYFVYESTTSTTGSLYLGDKLISNNVGGSGVNNLSELSDVIVNGANTGDFLVLNSEGKWTSVSASAVAATILESGGNFVSIDENQFQFNAINGKLELKGFSTATTGFVPVKSTTGIAWVSMPPDLSTQVGTLTSGLESANSAISSIQSDLQAVDGKILNAINNANHLTYQVIDNLAAATKENVVYLYSGGTSSTNNIYQEYLLTNGQLEIIGSTNVDLSQYATTSAVTALDTRVGTLETTATALATSISSIRIDLDNFMTAVSSNYVLVTTFNAVVGNLTAVNGTLNNLNSDASIAETITDIYDRLTWREISE